MQIEAMKGLGAHLLICAAAAIIATASAARAGHGVPVPPFLTSLSSNNRTSSAGNAGEQALREISRARREIGRAIRERRQNFESSNEWQQAIGAVRKTRADFEKARSEALETLRQNTEYKSAQIQIWKLQEDLDAARAQGKTQQVNDIALRLLAERSAVSRSEANALADDETIRQARYAMIDAQAKASALRRGFVESIQSDPQWRSARAQLDQARSHLASLGG